MTTFTPFVLYPLQRLVALACFRLGVNLGEIGVSGKCHQHANRAALFVECARRCAVLTLETAVHT